MSIRLPAILLLLVAGCAYHADNAPEPLRRVADFSLTERSGRTVSRSDLDGKVWVAAFFFTRCKGPCYQVSSAMAQLQERLAGRDDVTLVSFSVDPDHDTPAVLSEYAKRFQASPNRWLFLTGQKEKVYELVRGNFQLAAEPSADPQTKEGYEIDHSTRLAVVDRSGFIRGYFDATNADDLPRVLEAVDALTWASRLPSVNAVLNATCLVLLLLGYFAVRFHWIALHKACMLTALIVSAVFLTSYLYYHIVVRKGVPTYFSERAPLAPEWVRYAYMGVLGSHTLLAIAVAPLALVTAFFGLTNRLKRHVRLARWTLPIWLYVSATGVIVYWMLYRIYPSP